MNKCIFVGRLTADVEQKVTSAGAAVCSFNLAVDRDFKDLQGNRTTDFIPCVAWKQTAEFLSRYASKGDVISVCAELNSRKYEKDDRKITVWEAIVREAHIVSKVERKQEEAPKEEYEEVTDDDLPF